MKLIFVYGPPASGKLTIAEKLSEATGIPLFHNHLSRDIVKDIYADEINKHYSLVDKIRFDVFEYCAKNNTDLIFTYVYDRPDDNNNVKKFIDKIESNNSEILFVELTANKADLIKRVGNESRRKFKKLTDKNIMRNLTQDMSRFTIPFVNALRINTSELSPDKSIKIILSEFKLK